MEDDRHEHERRVVSWVVLGAAVACAVGVLSEIPAVVDEPQSGEGWIGIPIELVAMVGPLVLVGLGLRSHRPEVVRRTAVAAGVLAALVAFVLVMQLLDPNEIWRDRMVQMVGLATYVAAFAVSFPALRHRSGRSAPHAPRAPRAA